MNYWLTTDTHFFHKKMGEYCGRPEGFEDLIKEGLKVVKPGDVLIHLGDICIGQDVRAHKELLKPLKCKKWLIRGNHDEKTDKWYLDHGWDFVGDEVLLNKFAKRILLTHRPVLDGEYDINVHGHQHNNAHRDTESKKHSKQRLLAIEYTDYKPVLLRDFIN